MKEMKLTTPLTNESINQLKSGDSVLLNGIIYTARDAAHQRLITQNDRPFKLQGAVIYYTGPTPAKPGEIIGSCGPTTSYRMDEYSIPLIQEGLKGMIGKGPRSQYVIDAMKEYRAVYFAAPGGAGAFLSKFIKKCELAAYEDLGPEAIYKLEVTDFPVIVINDIYGNDFYNEVNPL
ncbi:MAG: fumarate hydratase [Elusimicrobia bacterium CG1_02_37_114]|nr:MAG: fumarate hydratase [Elusimicrobia bacterium CG1_02_37_114]PIZ13380.1 MAG: fumarate hydratase [Elusimicrobia bacterium CG_4_10_14_0_8_um_filter_37_32]